ncbi:MogA/MoaB family molybdenum cofactor biosynthesis protein [Microbacterium esteraromaticum]|uniref:MogA/MoaB family molybdenum cofactor biosynthesis protein n=1 Tax=Microbacterium esteraromaticum TaxID=57043 RepID=A0A939DY70_9MICO|nr:MogA/MoaB family molybdenum cofactor biosynthesis protein [Microbacterium esteraromaticum]MBN8207076.1 MogA/MoaB family molybdenum cofactor biosynthesis protein [Microbacterium esteraromaticum]MBN8417230.1 MogA/MoaB family molybdenum cofactor biosynthesis protein [Microbacterium esteraromaticum]
MSTAAVLTVSDRAAAGIRDDTAGPVAVAALREAGFDCADASVVSDGADAVAQALRGFLATGIRLVVTTGGTGVAPRDETPEGTSRVIERMLPGVAEQLRRAGATMTPTAMLSRGVAGVSGRTFIVNLPGSPKAVAEGMPIVLSIAQHVLDQLDGEDHR